MSRSSFTILGILNLTPDSFSDGGKFVTPAVALRHATEMRAAGADLIDIGGESTRPGARALPAGRQAIAVTEEIRRVLSIVKKLHAQGFRLSLDSRRSAVVEACLPFVEWLNDVSGLVDPALRKLAAASGKKVILMHSRELPVDPQKVWRTSNPIADLKKFFVQRVRECERDGIAPRQIMLDPGIGFGKNLQQNLAILVQLREIVDLGFPVCLGASRKSFIGKIDGSDASDRLGGSLAAAVLGFRNGARVFRVHDVGETRQALQVASLMES